MLRGRLEGESYRLMNAPGFAKLLSISSLTTMASLLAGEGIPFTRTASDFELSDEMVVLYESRAFGGALGLHISGTIDRKADIVDLEGTLVPAYTINNVLGYIPVIGPAILGRRGSRPLRSEIPGERPR